MKALFFIFFCIFYFFTYFVPAQNIRITYFSKLSPNDKYSGVHLENSYTLLLKNNESVYFSHIGDSATASQYKTNYTDKPQQEKKIQVSENNWVTLAQKKYEVFYKNYQKDSLIYKDVMMSEKNKVFIGEKISSLFAWKIISNADSTILGYKCQKATADFRGRKYVAYFTNKIATMGGPWKFDGLPGMILYVKSEDDFFVIEPQKIEINKDTQKIGNYYEGKNVVSWETYKNMFREQIEKIVKRAKARSSSGVDGVSIKITGRVEDLGIPEMGFKK